jgi:hypothetical protein
LWLDRSHISYFLYCIASVVELFVNVILDVIIKERLGQWSWSREETNALGLGPADGFVSPGQGDVRRNTDMTDFLPDQWIVHAAGLLR